MSDYKIKGDINGCHVTVTVSESGKSRIELTGKVTPEVRKEADRLQYSELPPQVIFHRIMRIA